MKKRMSVLVCDRTHHRTPVEAITQMRLVLGNERYELDLCLDCKRELTTRVKPFLIRRRPHKTNPSNAATRRQSARVRAWAEAHGIVLAERGRIPRSVHEAYAQEAPR